MDVANDDVIAATTDGTGDNTLIQSLSGLSRDELTSKIMNDPQLYKVILNNQDKLEEILNQNGTGDTASAGALPQGEASQGTALDTEEPVSVSIKLSQLGTYGKNRKADEAIQELVKGVTEKDNYINFFKTQKVPALESELQSTKGKVATLQEELERLRKGAPQAQELDAAGDDLPDDFDQFDPDHVETLVKAHKGLRQTVKDLEARISGKGGHNPAAPATTTATTSDDIDNEFRQINMVTQNPENAQYFGLTRDVKVVEQEYIGFIKDLASATGYSGDILSANGNFHPAVQQIIQSYSDTNSQIRGVADRNGIRPPEDVGALSKVYKLKSIRSTYARKNAQGEMEPLSYEESFQIMRNLEPQTQPQQSPAMQQALADSQRMARALENKAQFSREPKANEGVDLSASGNAANQRFMELSRKNRHTHTPTEKEFMASYYKTNAGFTDQEVEDWYKPSGR